MESDFSSPSVQTTAPATKKWCQVIRSAAPVTQNHLSKPEDQRLQNATPLRKSVPGPPNSSDEHVSCTCFAPQRRALFRHLNFQKVLGEWCALYFLTSECTSRQNGVHFFDISTSNCGPSMVCFVHFDFEMCFAPQQCALFRHLNFQKWSEHGVLCTF